MRTNNVRLMLLLCVLALYGCATPIQPASVPVEVSAAKLAPAPADVMVPREANFRQRLLNFFSTSPSMPTTSPDNSQPAKKYW